MRLYKGWWWVRVRVRGLALWVGFAEFEEAVTYHGSLQEGGAK